MGTYVATTMKSINDENKLIVHKPARNMDDLLDDSNKKVIRKAKNRMAHEVRETYFWAFKSSISVTQDA